MKIEFHNAHGHQLILTLTPTEAASLIAKLLKSLTAVLEDHISRYATFQTLFENDNDRWEPTRLDIMVEGNPNSYCQSIEPETDQRFQQPEPSSFMTLTELQTAACMNGHHTACSGKTLHQDCECVCHEPRR